MAFLERVTGIEPALSAWKAGVLPLNYTRKSRGDYTPILKAFVSNPMNNPLSGPRMAIVRQHRRAAFSGAGIGSARLPWEDRVSRTGVDIRRFGTWGDELPENARDREL